MNKSVISTNSGTKRVYRKPQMKIVLMTTEALLVGSEVIPNNTLDIEYDTWPVDPITSEPLNPW